MIDKFDALLTRQGVDCVLIADIPRNPFDLNHLRAGPASHYFSEQQRRLRLGIMNQL